MTIKCTAPVLIREAVLHPVRECGLKKDGGAWYELSDGFRYVLNKKDFEHLGRMIERGYVLKFADSAKNNV
jgi:hypothetical protein